MTADSAKIYKYDGRSMTLKEWSSELGIKLVTLYYRLHKGWPISMVLGQPIDVSKKGRRHVYTYKGKTATAAEWARVTGIPEGTLHYRLTHKKTWSIEKALTTPYTPTIEKHPTQLTLNGETKSVAEWADKLGMRVGTLRMRIYRGGNVEDILNPVVEASRLHKPLNVTFKGETHNLSEWAALTGISTATLSLRLHSGWKLDDVFGKDVVGREAEKFELDGESKTLPEWARQYGKSETLVRSRLHVGWDLKKALLSPLCPCGRTAKLVAYNGRSKTLGEWAKEYGISENNLRTRLYQGWSMERALTTPNRKAHDKRNAKR